MIDHLKSIITNYSLFSNEPKGYPGCEIEKIMQIIMLIIKKIYFIQLYNQIKIHFTSKTFGRNRLINVKKMPMKHQLD